MGYWELDIVLNKIWEHSREALFKGSCESYPQRRPGTTLWSPDALPTMDNLLEFFPGLFVHVA